MELKGKIKAILDEQISEKGFKSRGIIITTDEKYPQDIKMEAFKDKCSMFDSYKIGQNINASFNLRGNEWKGKYFVNLNIWKIESLETENIIPVEKKDDLPF